MAAMPKIYIDNLPVNETIIATREGKSFVNRIRPVTREPLRLNNNREPVCGKINITVV